MTIEELTAEVARLTAALEEARAECHAKTFAALMDERDATLARCRQLEEALRAARSFVVSDVDTYYQHDIEENEPLATMVKAIDAALGQPSEGDKL